MTWKTRGERAHTQHSLHYFSLALIVVVTTTLADVVDVEYIIRTLAADSKSTIDVNSRFSRRSLAINHLTSSKRVGHTDIRPTSQKNETILQMDASRWGVGFEPLGDCLHPASPHQRIVAYKNKCTRKDT